SLALNARGSREGPLNTRLDAKGLGHSVRPTLGKENRMNPRQIALVQATWRHVLPIKERAAELFYQRLFELDPDLRPMFLGDIAEQGRKLMAMLGAVVSRLDQLGEVVGAAQDLGRRHAGYGVADSHYDTVGAALLGTLRAGLGEAWSAE